MDSDRSRPLQPERQPSRDAGSRAEKFEEEKNRIIDSCFSKTDSDGSLQETYITHIRITEFATHPSSPPPPEAHTRQNEKPRVIIVSVKKNGRVRMHKAKENANRTFSIGKTWTLDDLKAIESFTGPQCNPEKAALAGATGFTVTIGKPYFWKAQAEKEKRFFIASLIKIFSKYTGGNQPELIGFDQRELDQVTGVSSTRRPPPVVAPPARSSPADVSGRNPSVSSTSTSKSGYPRDLPSASSTSPQNAITSDVQSSLPPQFPQSSPLRQPRMTERMAVSPSGSIDSSRVGNGSFDSGRTPREPSLRKLASGNKSQDSIANSFTTTKSDDTAPAIPAARRVGAMRLGEPIQQPSLDMVKDDPPPTRRRPPMDPSRPSNGSDVDLVPAPLIPGQKQEPSVPPRSSERMSPRKERTGTQPVSSIDLRSELGSFKEKIAQAQASEVTSRSKLQEKVDKFAPSPALSPAVTPARPATPATAEDKPAPTTQTPKLTLAGVLRKAVEVAKSSSETGSPVAQADTTSRSPSPIKSPPSEAQSSSAQEEEERPGLGLMVKQKSKGDIAGAFWKAATVAGVFKPRAGGAMDQFRKAQNKSDGPDGITSVVPAPAKLSKEGNNSSSVPEVRVSVPGASRPSSMQPENQEEPNEADRIFPTGNDEKYLQALGVDSTILDKRAKDLTHWLDYFHWVPGDHMRRINLDDMKVDIEREITKTQAGGWVARFQEDDDRVDAIKRGLDNAIAECDELENLLTLYSVELGTLQDDIAYIEAQGQGLQVQAANQKTLQKELESLLNTCAISSRDLEALRISPLETPQGLEEIEETLVTLYRAMHKIDPTVGNADVSGKKSDSDQVIGFNSDYGNMRIVREKKAMYTEESSTFLRRLIEFLTRRINDAFRETTRAIHEALSKKADPTNHDRGRDLLWMYSPVLLYARDIDLNSWNRAMQIYQEAGSPVYKDEFRVTIDAWKRYARKVTGEDEVLFTAVHDKHEQSSLTTTARKLTVKRSQNLARTLRGGESKASLQDKTENRSLPYEVFSGVADDILRMVEMEQNFIIDLFHASTLEQTDFPDAVAAARPINRHGGDLKRHRLMEPDRELARRITRAMETTFSFLEHDLQSLIDWVLGQDSLQGVGVLATIERKQIEIAQTNQDFLNNVLGKLHANLVGRFNRFVDEQVRAIEETKVKINKRRGVISFVRVFPPFSAIIEDMLVHAGGGNGTHENTQAPGTRRIIDSAYERIIKIMFDSLKVIARENPSTQGLAAATGHSSADEDKESLNLNILLIENTHHFLEEIDTRGLPVLEDWCGTIQHEFVEHMNLYISTVMRRPLGRLLEYLENIEAQLATGNKPAAYIASQPTTNKQAFNKVMGAYDAREIRKGIEALRKRIEKHFGEEEHTIPHMHSSSNNAGGKVLVSKVFREAEHFYRKVETRIGKVIAEVYGGDVLFEWPRAEVKGAFQAAAR